MFLPPAALTDKQSPLTAQRAWRITGPARTPPEVEGMTDESYVIPLSTWSGPTCTAAWSWGLPGRRQGRGQSFGFLGRLDDRICLYSQRTAWRRAISRKAGPRRQDGLQADLLTPRPSADSWAFHPLQAGNANLNLARLNVASPLRRHMYGERSDGPDAGVPPIA